MRFYMLLTAGLSLTIASPSLYSGLGLLESNEIVQRAPGKGGSNAETKPGAVPRPKAAEVKKPPPGPGGDKFQKGKEKEELESLKHQAPPYEKGIDLQLPTNRRIASGETGWRLINGGKTVEIYYGDKAPRHGLNVAWNNIANGKSPTTGIRMYQASSEQKREQRSNALRYLKKEGGTILDEKPAASLSHEEWWSTIVRVSSQESQFEARMYTRAHAFAKEHPSFAIQYFDNRSQFVKADMEKQMHNGDLALYRGPKVDGLPAPKHQTADFTSGKTKQTKQTRDILGSMKAQESSQQDPENENRTKAAEYFDAFESVQRNTTDMIWPSIANMLAQSTNPLVSEAAFAVYAHLTMAPVSLSGPFAYGMNALDDYEDRLLDSGASNATMTVVYAFNGVLLDLYEMTWQNASAAADAEGLLEDLVFLADYLDPKDSSLLPEAFTTVDPTGSDYYHAFFASDQGFFNAPGNGSTSGDEKVRVVASSNATNTTVHDFRLRSSQPLD